MEKDRIISLFEYLPIALVLYSLACFILSFYPSYDWVRDVMAINIDAHTLLIAILFAMAIKYKWNTYSVLSVLHLMTINVAYNVYYWTRNLEVYGSIYFPSLFVVFIVYLIMDLKA